MDDDSIDETLRRRFESAWAEGHPEPIERCLPPEDDPRYLSTLEELVQIELEFRWKSWTRRPQHETAETVAAPAGIESYLERFPELKRPEIIRRLIEQECLARKRSGHPVSIDDYRDRFPGILAEAIETRSLLREAGAEVTELMAHPEPTVDQHATATAGYERLGRFGNYELLEVIGRGGMGVVYRARQLSADRIVALKVISRERLEGVPQDSRADTLGRFRHEAQAAARLEHENIVTVYEVGEVDGEPFFSMRYVEGQSLAEMLRQRPLSGRKAAEYIEPVARALQEAHSHGILHRDLKPQNVLVDAKTDQPLVADFGLAKFTEIDEELTQAGEIMGTPQFMSPEQARDSSRVTAQSDVYSLGATLYHVLTGKPPFQGATGLETLRMLLDEDPVPPRRLNPAIDRDLETICLKCLEKEPSRRYDSAAAMAHDLRRYLHGEPIVARPIGPLGRLVRWCRRKPAVAALAGSTVLFLVLALVASVIGYLKTSAALKDAQVARADAERNYQQAREAVDRFFTQVSENRLLNEPGMQRLRHELLSLALEYYQRFLTQRGDDPTIRDELARAHFRIGRITEEIASPEEALAAYAEARRFQTALVAETPEDLARLEALGDTWSAIGRVYTRLRRYDEAIEACQQAADVRQRMVDRASDNLEFKRGLANSLMNLGLVRQECGQFDQAMQDFGAAQTLRREILALRRDWVETRRDYGKGEYNLAVLAKALDDFDSAREHFQEAINVFEGLLKDDAEDLAYQYSLATCYRLLADVLWDSADAEKAIAYYESGLAVIERLARENPDVAKYQAELASLSLNLGSLKRDNLPEAAQDLLQQAVDIFRRLFEQYPEIAAYRRNLGVALRELGALQADTGKSQIAAKNLRLAEQHFEDLLREFPGDSHLATQLELTRAALKELGNREGE